MRNEEERLVLPAPCTFIGAVRPGPPLVEHQRKMVDAMSARDDYPLTDNPVLTVLYSEMWNEIDRLRGELRLQKAQNRAMEAIMIQLMDDNDAIRADRDMILRQLASDMGRPVGI